MFEEVVDALKEHCEDVKIVKHPTRSNQTKSISRTHSISDSVKMMNDMFNDVQTFMKFGDIYENNLLKITDTNNQDRLPPRRYNTINEHAMACREIPIIFESPFYLRDITAHAVQPGIYFHIHFSAEIWIRRCKIIKSDSGRGDEIDVIVLEEKIINESFPMADGLGNMIASCISLMLDDNDAEASMNAEKVIITSSSPLEHIHNHMTDSAFVSWGSRRTRFNGSDPLLGVDLNLMIKNKLDMVEKDKFIVLGSMNSLISISVAAAVNDNVTINNRPPHTYDHVLMVVTIGEGCNVCLIHGPENRLVNLELGAYSGDLPMTYLDVEVDQRSGDLHQTYSFEKLTCGIHFEWLLQKMVMRALGGRNQSTALWGRRLNAVKLMSHMRDVDDCAMFIREYYELPKEIDFNESKVLHECLDMVFSRSALLIAVFLDNIANFAIRTSHSLDVHQYIGTSGNYTNCPYYFNKLVEAMQKVMDIRRRDYRANMDFMKLDWQYDVGAVIMASCMNSRPTQMSKMEESL